MVVAFGLAVDFAAMGTLIQLGAAETIQAFQLVMNFLVMPIYFLSGATTSGAALAHERQPTEPRKETPPRPERRSAATAADGALEAPRSRVRTATSSSVLSQSPSPAGDGRRTTPTYAANATPTFLVTRAASSPSSGMGVSPRACNRGHPPVWQQLGIGVHHGMPARPQRLRVARRGTSTIT